MITNSMLHRNALASALALVLSAPLAAHAQSGASDAAPADDDATEVDRVVVTGSRIKRADIEGPAPVTVISAEQIKAEGFVTVYDALTTLNEAIGTVEADVQWGSHTPNASPLNLRNMGPGRSLLLVNGRRVADYPLPYGGQSNFANYSNIPAAAVERIEVLTGGASAIYGSDAVAGVVNIILKQNYQGDEVRVRGGTSTEGGRDTWDLSWAGGKGGQNWNLTYALQYTKRDPLFGRDRPAMDDSSDAHPDSWNPEQRKVGFRPFSGLALIDAATGLRQAPPPGTCDKFHGEYYLANRLVYNRNSGAIRNTGQLCGMTADFANWMLMSGAESSSGYLYGTWDFADGLQAWASLAVNDSKALWSTAPPSVYLVNDNNGYYFDAGSNQYLIGVRQFTPQEVGGVDALRNGNKEVSWDLSAGLRGTFGDGRFDWDASLGRARYTVTERIAVVHEQRAYDFFLGPRLGTTADGEAIYNLDEQRWWNPVTPEQYRQFGTRSVNEAASWVDQGSFSVSGELFQGWAGPIGFAGVLEAARQGYELNPDPRAGIDYDVQNIDRGGGERQRASAGVEFSVPLLSSLTATLAARYDRYDDYEARDSANRLAIGSQSETTWNAGLQWRPLDNLLVRGTYATSFRAPDMHYLLAQPSSSAVSTIDPLRCIESGAYLINNCTAGNPDVYYAFNINRRGTPDLRSELGDSWTVGLVWDALDNLSFTADYWSISLEDEIRDLDQGIILRDEAGCRTGKTTTPGQAWSNPGGAEYCTSVLSRVTRDAGGRIVAVERGPINIAQKEVEGLDASMRYRIDANAWGSFNIGLNYTNLQVLKEQTYRTDPNPNRRDRDIRSKIRGSVSWENGNWNATVYGDRIGSVPGVRHHWGTDRLNDPGGCTPFADGGVPDDRANCRDTNPASPTFGQSTSKYYGRVGPAITWNFNVGYRITDNARVNFYVNNVFNSAGWNHKDPYKLDYEFYNSRLFSPVGREVAMEYVFKFN